MRIAIGVVIAFVLALLLIGALSRVIAIANADTVHPNSILHDSGWEKRFKTTSKTRDCTWKNRAALCKSVRVWVHRYGYVGGTSLIYDSGQNIKIVWRAFHGSAHYCLRCLLSVRATNYQHTLSGDLTWDWDGVVDSVATGPCTVGEHLFGHGCKVTYRKHTNKFVNHFIILPVGLDRTEVAGVTTKIWINQTDRAHGLSILSSGICC